MTFCSSCGQQLAIRTEKFCPNCGQDLKIGGAVSVSRNPSINIGNIQGDVMGVGFLGDGNIIGKNITVGSVGIGEQQLQKIPTEYADSLKAVTDPINQQFKANNVRSAKVADVQRNVSEFSQELEGVNQDNVQELLKSQI
jgi:hypothetical protein